MGRSKELFEKLNNVNSAVEFNSRLELLRQMEEELIDPLVPENIKRTILKAILA